MSINSGETFDRQPVIDLSSHNLGSRLNDSFPNSMNAAYTSGLDQHISSNELLIRRNYNQSSSHESPPSGVTIPSGERLLLSPYEEELYLRSLRLNKVPSNNAIPTVTMLAEDGKPKSKSAVPLPYMQDFEQFQAEQEKNHLRRKQQSDENDSWLDAFTKWSKYSSRKFKRGIKHSKPLKRTHSSIRRKDFTVNSEYQKYNKQGKFIFHKGFSARNNSNNSIQRKYSVKTHRRMRSRFKNEQELMSYMRYINISELDITEVVNDDYIRMFFLAKNSLKSLVSVHPPINSFRVPLNQYNEILRKVSKRKITSPNLVKRPSISRKLSAKNRRVCRSSTAPIIRKSFAERLNPELYDVWNSYLKAIITKRIELRLSCLLSEDMSSLVSSLDSPPIIRVTNAPEMEQGTSTNPIIIDDDNDKDEDDEDEDNLYQSSAYQNPTYNQNTGTLHQYDISDNDSEINSRPTTSVFSIRQSMTSADQNRQSFFFPPDDPRMHKIDEEKSIHSITSRNTIN